MEKADIYFQEIRSQIGSARRCFNAFQLASKNHSVEAFVHVHHFVVHVANIDKLLDCSNSQRRRTVLQGHINLDSTSLKPLRRLRNHLEHFDERLDKWVEEFDGHALLDENFISGTKGFPDRAYLRALDGAVFKFYGETFDLAELLQKIEEIERQIGAASSRKPQSKETE